MAYTIASIWPGSLGLGLPRRERQACRYEAYVPDPLAALDLALPEGEGWSTVAGLCLELTGRIPATGEVLRTPDGTTLEIADAIPRQVRRVRLRRRAAEEAPEPGGEPAAAGSDGGS